MRAAASRRTSSDATRRLSAGGGDATTRRLSASKGGAPRAKRRSLRGVVNAIATTNQSSWSGVVSRMAELDDDGGAQEFGYSEEQIKRIKAELATHEVQAMRLSKPGGNERKLTLREQITMRAIMRQPSKRTDEDVMAIVQAVRFDG